jgi:hypothetical protein
MGHALVGWMIDQRIFFAEFARVVVPTFCSRPGSFGTDCISADD